MSATSKPKLYNPRHPERTLLYQTVAEHYETWLASAGQFDGQGDHHTPSPSCAWRWRTDAATVYAMLSAHSLQDTVDTRP
jgi:hypothetical protein